MPGHRILRFSLDIKADRYLDFYKGIARRISAVTDNGKRIEFDARHVRPFLTKDGIKGAFEMEIDQNNRFVSIKKTG
ncbi:MAG: DUF2835 domain-containing protein [Gammaproteobacteria bacterium]